jgi:hypothetical protein
MPVHVKHEPSALLIVLNRDGEEAQTRRAVGGEQALLLPLSCLWNVADCAAATYS